MKKLLLGATALLTISASGAALAQGAPPTTVSTSNFNARVGGFMTAGIGYVDSEAHDAGVEIVNNAEVTFNFTLAADNGLTFGAKVEFEAQGTSENADEYVAFVEGFFGRVEVGREDGAQDRLAPVAAGATSFTAAADETGLLFDYASSESTAVPITYGADSGDELKITYFTPAFFGFQAGASYVPGNDSADGPREFGQGGTSSVGSDDSDEALEFGAVYKGEFGGFSVVAGGGYSTFLDDASKGLDYGYSLAANVGFAGFTVGAMYGETVGATDNAGTPGSDRDNTGYGVGAGYTTGPWTFGVQYAENIDGPNEDDYGISLGADYALAPGVTVGGILEYADGELQATTANPGSDDAFAAGVFMNLDF
jgi:outer membrane protein OmpU